jgi:tetratricopeptide (TPR) repeat protein
MLGRLSIFVSCLAIIATSFAAKPQILLVPQQVQEFTERDPNLDLLPVFANTLQETGWVTTSQWFETNPLIVAAIADGILRSYSPNPSPADVFRVARAIRADFVIFCSARLVGGGVRGDMELFRSSGGRSIFKDENSVQILIEGAIDKPSSILSIANTFTTKLFAGPLKEFAVATPIQTPPATHSTVTTTARLPIDKTPFESGMTALNEGRIIEALSLLRDAVDADPTHGAARLGLIEALRRAGKPFLAADEAMRGAELNPHDISLVVVAADCYLSAGQPERARATVRAVLAANPSSDEAWLVYGDVCLSTLNNEEALSAYSKSINIKPTADAFYKRAQAYALLEDFQASNRDMESAKSLGLDDDPVKMLGRYRETIKVVDNVFVSLATRVRNIIVEARVAAGPDIIRRARETAGSVNSFSEFVAKLVPPDVHSRSHDQRLLALSLLVQAALVTQDFVNGGGAETGDEANLLQIEAMREFGAGQSIYEKESK